MGRKHTGAGVAMGSMRRAHRDFVEGFLGWRLWLGLGVRDIKIRYQRTWLGPLWITLGTSATFVSMGMLFSAVLKNDVRTYLPYLAGGMVSWSLLQAVAADGPRIFVDAHHVITSLRLPLVVHVMRCLVRNGIVFFHNAMAVIAVHLALGNALTPASLLLFATLPVFFAALFSGGLILAIVGARFRDLGPMIGTALQLAFFMTPIIWSPDDIPQASKWWIRINPLHHLIEIVRAPLLGDVPDTTSVIFATATAILSGLGAYGAYCLFRRRISYWL